MKTVLHLEDYSKPAIFFILQGIWVAYSSMSTGSSHQRNLQSTVDAWPMDYSISEWTLVIIAV